MPLLRDSSNSQPVEMRRFLNGSTGALFNSGKTLSSVRTNGNISWRNDGIIVCPVGAFLAEFTIRQRGNHRAERVIVREPRTMTFAAIKKDRQAFKITPNLTDYAGAYAAFPGRTRRVK